MSLIALAGAAPARAVSRSFFGLQAWSTPSSSEFANMVRGGAGTFRVNLVWSSVEPRRGQRRWTDFDAAISRAATVRMSVLPVLIGSPRFAAPRFSYPPRRQSAKRAWAAFVRAAVDRYGPSGDFWNEHPELPERPIHAWQVWNEPNFPPYWYRRPNAREYLSFLALTRRAIKNEDPDAHIVFAGLPEALYRGRRTRMTFLSEVYRTRGATRLFDVMAIHPYASTPSRMIRLIGEIRAFMNRHHDGRTPIWITEFGWATAGVTGRFLVTSRSGQATKLAAGYRDLLGVRHRYRIGTAIWFSWRDRAPREDEGNWWGIHTGLFDRDGRAKPSWRAYERAAGAT